LDGGSGGQHIVHNKYLLTLDTIRIEKAKCPPNIAPALLKGEADLRLSVTRSIQTLKYWDPQFSSQQSGQEESLIETSLSEFSPMQGDGNQVVKPFVAKPFPKAFLEERSKRIGETLVAAELVVPNQVAE
jgi:hypothetical protein